MPVNLDPGQLTTPNVGSIGRTKYFPIEIFCTNMRPNTTYDAYFDGVLVNAFCKPWGGDLGAALTSDDNGRLMVLFLFSIQYYQQFLMVQNVDKNTVNASKVFELRSPTGTSSITYIPMVLKTT